MRAAVLSLLLPFVSLAAGVPSSWESRGVGGGGALFSPSFSPHRAGELFVACDMSELFHTTNGAASWRTVDFREIQGNRSTRVQFTSDSNLLYAIDNTSVDGGDTHRPARSLDGGVTWAPLATDPTGMETYWLAADPSATNRILLSDYSTLYVSGDGGATFSNKYSFGGGGNGFFIGGAVFGGPVILLGTTAGLLISTNGGNAFFVYPAGGIPANEEIAFLAGARLGATWRLFCTTVEQGTLYPGILIEDVYGAPAVRKVYSLDVGQLSWTVRTNGLSSSHYLPFVGMSTGEASTVYLFGEDSSEYPVAYKSVNAGTNWTQSLIPVNNVNARTGWEGWGGDRDWTYGAYYVGFAVSPRDPLHAAFTDYGFVHVTTNGGATWDAAYVRADERHPANAATPKGQSYRSIGLEDTTCWGVTWADSNSLWACFSDLRGLRSTNGGIGWCFDYSGNGFNSTYQCLRHPDGTLYASASSVHDLYQSTYLTDSRIDGGDGEVLRSTDLGKTWTTVHDFNHVVYGLALDPNRTNVLYAGVAHSVDGGVYVTSNLQANGSSAWTKLPNPPRTQGHPRTLLVLNDGTLVCTYDGRRDGAGAFTAGSGIFVSTNGGSSWIDRSHTNMFYWTKDVVPDPYDPAQSSWYVCVWSGWGGAPNDKGGLYRTTNRGVTWSRLSSSDRVSSCAFSPVYSNELFFTTEQEGLWFTTNARAATPSFAAVTNYPFKQPERVVFNPYAPREIWVTSFGHGLRVGRVAPAQPEVRGVSVSAGGRVIQWSGDAGSLYDVHRSFDLHAFFVPVESNLTGTVFTDTVDAVAAFYRIEAR